MSRSRREEGEKEGRGPGLIGERTEKTHSYEHAGWRSVDSMLKGEYPTTNIGTVCAAGKNMGHYNQGGSVEREQRKDVEDTRDHMRDNMDKYAHAKKGGSMKGGGAQEGAMRSSKPHVDKAHGFAAGGVGKIRKGQY